MVRINPRHHRGKSASKLQLQRWLLGLIAVVATLVAMVLAFVSAFPGEAAVLERSAEEELKLLEQIADRKIGGVAIPEERKTFGDEEEVAVDQPTTARIGVRRSRPTTTCPYTKLSDLTAAERYPVASKERHIVTPPKDGAASVALVCCDTTAGPWNILVHRSWAPIGARRFLEMVEAAYFDSTVPLMRCVKNFLCQFGLSGVPAAMQPFKATIPDDPNWLPGGPDHRQNELGVKRFQRGYMAYAGSGKDSRNIQLIVALRDNGPLAGGSPWEVPWGELVGAHSYETLSKIYTGYGEDGPKQGLLWKADALRLVKEKFPEMDYVTSCRVVDQEGGQQ